jgi:methionyl aminopeptidase
MANGVFLKSEEELEKIEKACRIARLILRQLQSRIHAGIKTGQIDEWARKLSKDYCVRPAFLGYHGYPASICVSINEEVVHGIPGARVLEGGDVVSLDFGVCFEGYYGDTALTFVMGCSANPRVLRLLQVTEAALYYGIEKAIPGNRIGDVSAAIQGTIEGAGFAVVRDFVGHGLGKNLHEEPQIPGYGKAGTGKRIQPGMVLAIEPMANLGTYRVEILKDGWTAITEDRSVSAHFEHTIAITDGGNRILTQCSET